MGGGEAKQTDAIPDPGSGPARQPMAAGAVVRRIALHAGCLLVAVAGFGAYEHFRIHGEWPQSLASLTAAAGFALVPLRAVLRALFDVEHRILHWVHGAAGLVLIALSLAGVISGGPLLSHAAMAPFAIMGAAQAIMHQNHPRSPEQAEALRRFATSLPEVAQFTQGSLTSPENAARAVAVLGDLIQKAQALGETELRADPGFQSALNQVGTRFGLSLGLDVADRAIAELARNPAAAGAVPDLRRRVAAVRQQIDPPRPPEKKGA